MLQSHVWTWSGTPALGLSIDGLSIFCMASFSFAAFLSFRQLGFRPWRRIRCSRRRSRYRRNHWTRWSDECRIFNPWNELEGKYYSLNENRTLWNIDKRPYELFWKIAWFTLLLMNLEYRIPTWALPTFVQLSLRRHLKHLQWLREKDRFVRKKIHCSLSSSEPSNLEL